MIAAWVEKEAVETSPGRRYLGPGLRQLGPHDHRDQPADEEEKEGRATGTGSR